MMKGYQQEDELDDTALLDLPNELRGEIRSYYEGEMEAAGFVHRLRSISNELDRHAESIEKHADEVRTDGGNR